MTVNPHKGDVPLIVGEKTFTLRFSHLALVKLEDALDKSLVDIMFEMQNADKGQLRMKTVASLLWAGLQKHHPNISFEVAAEMIDEVDGGAATVVTVVGEAFQKAFAAPETKGTHPRSNGEAGTGMDFLSSSSATAMTPKLSGN